MITSKLSKSTSDELRRQRGRPRTFDREAALDTAVRLFWRHGYEGTSIADLTAAIGMTPPTLYAAFGAKEDLYRAVLARYFDREGARERAEAFQREPVAYRAIEGYLREIARELVNPTKPLGCMTSAAVLQCAAENQAAADAVAAFRAAAIELWRFKFEEAKRESQLPGSVDTHALARFYNAVIGGMSVQASDGATMEALNGLVDVALAAWPGTTRKTGAAARAATSGRRRSS